MSENKFEHRRRCRSIFFKNNQGKCDEENEREDKRIVDSDDLLSSSTPTKRVVVKNTVDLNHTQYGYNSYTSFGPSETKTISKPVGNNSDITAQIVKENSATADCNQVKSARKYFSEDTVLNNEHDEIRGPDLSENTLECLKSKGNVDISMYPILRLDQVPLLDKEELIVVSHELKRHASAYSSNSAQDDLSIYIKRQLAAISKQMKLNEAAERVRKILSGEIQKPALVDGEYVNARMMNYTSENYKQNETEELTPHLETSTHSTFAIDENIKVSHTVAHKKQSMTKDEQLIVNKIQPKPNETTIPAWAQTLTQADSGGGDKRIEDERKQKRLFHKENQVKLSQSNTENFVIFGAPNRRAKKKEEEAQKEKMRKHAIKRAKQKERQRKKRHMKEKAKARKRLKDREAKRALWEKERNERIERAEKYRQDALKKQRERRNAILAKEKINSAEKAKAETTEIFSIDSILENSNELEMGEEDFDEELEDLQQALEEERAANEQTEDKDEAMKVLNIEEQDYKSDDNEDMESYIEDVNEQTDDKGGAMKVINSEEHDDQSDDNYDIEENTEDIIDGDEAITSEYIPAKMLHKERDKSQAEYYDPIEPENDVNEKLDPRIVYIDSELAKLETESKSKEATEAEVQAHQAKASSGCVSPNRASLHEIGDRAQRIVATNKRILFDSNEIDDPSNPVNSKVKSTTDPVSQTYGEVNTKSECSSESQCKENNSHIKPSDCESISLPLKSNSSSVVNRHSSSIKDVKLNVDENKEKIEDKQDIQPDYTEYNEDKINSTGPQESQHLQVECKETELKSFCSTDAVSSNTDRGGDTTLSDASGQNSIDEIQCNEEKNNYSESEHQISGDESLQLVVDSKGTETDALEETKKEKSVRDKAIEDLGGIVVDYGEFYPTFGDILSITQDSKSKVKREIKEETLKHLFRLFGSFNRISKSEVLQYNETNTNDEKADNPNQSANNLSTRLIRILYRSHTEVYNVVKDACNRLAEDNNEMNEMSDGLSSKAVWNLLWTWTKPKIDRKKLLSWQRVNHFVNAKLLTRKDLLKQNLEKFQFTTGESEILPATFILPKEYLKFVSAFSEASEIWPRRNYWIMKPVGLSRGRGISLVTDISDVCYGESVIIQRYIHDPLLLDGYKFDLRLYVLVTSFNPLEAWVYEEGFVRLCTYKYSCEKEDMNNLFVHLTNTSIQRHGVDGAGIQATTASMKRHAAGVHEAGGTKLSLEYLWRRLSDMNVDVAEVKRSIEKTIIKSLISVNDSIEHQVNSFELFGYDILLDRKLKPWLIEINSSPSMGMDNELDRKIKRQLVYDTVRLVNPITFDREVLCEVVQRRLQEAAMDRLRPYHKINEFTESELGKTKARLNKDLTAILKGRTPRKYGEMPANPGLYKRIAPDEPIFDKINKSKSSLRSSQLKGKKKVNRTNTKIMIPPGIRGKGLEFLAAGAGVKI